ncbi:MAG: thioredoxin family protein, partial [Alphaproteobacteria bacterium]|nr:thioredoxin family protein [Alphaproteobacteria bacterium]
MRLFFITALALFALTGSAHAAPAPHMAETSFDQLAQPLPLPYNEHADARKDIAAAREAARLGHKLLLIDFGGNWCLDCRILAGTIRLPDLAPFVARHYVVVTVDVGRFTKNLDLTK